MCGNCEFFANKKPFFCNKIVLSSVSYKGKFCILKAIQVKEILLFVGVNSALTQGYGLADYRILNVGGQNELSKEEKSRSVAL